MKHGDLVRVHSHAGPWFLPNPYTSGHMDDWNFPSLDCGELGIFLELSPPPRPPEKLVFARLITRFGIGWVGTEYIVAV